MAQWFDIKAGPKAYRFIQQNGLSPEQVKTVFGASGAAKWLTIYGLDRAIFSQWLPSSSSSHEVLLYGTSVGAFKLAAACHNDSAAGLDGLKHSYIHQTYPNGGGRDEVEREFNNIAQQVVAPEHIPQILSHPRYRLALGSVRCLKGLASDDARAQMRTCAGTALANACGRSGMSRYLERCIFFDDRAEFPIALVNDVSPDGFRTHQVALRKDNLRSALKASGSIPIAMYGVENVPGAPEGIYRDGGLLDYHPVPSSFWQDDGLILYPHFYSHCTVGWFDQFLPWRKTKPEDLDQVVMISPSQAFIDTFELGCIPDRGDFKRFDAKQGGNSDERIRLWTQAAEQSLKLGEAFLELADKGQLESQVRPL